MMLPGLVDGRGSVTVSQRDLTEAFKRSQLSRKANKLGESTSYVVSCGYRDCGRGGGRGRDGFLR